MTRKLLVVWSDDPVFTASWLKLYLDGRLTDAKICVQEAPSAAELGRVALQARPMLGTYENDCEVVGVAILDALTKHTEGPNA